MQPNLPRKLLGNLYNLLSITAWRQGDYPEGLRRASRAREIGEATGDPSVVVKAVLNLATIHSMIGPADKALQEFQFCLAHPKHFDTQRDHGATLSNIAWLYRDAVNFSAALKAQKASIRIFERLKFDFNLGISWCAMGAYFIELGRLDEALEALNKARSYSQRARCDYGVICDDLYVADIDGLSGRSSKAIEVVERRMPELLKYESIDLFCLEIAARQHRLAGRMRASHRYIGEGDERVADRVGRCGRG